MDRVTAFRRGSTFAANGKRRSVSWTVNQTTSDGQNKDRTESATDTCPEGGGGGGDDKKGKGKDAGSDLKEIGLWYGGSLVINTLVGPGIFGTPKAVLAGVGSIGMSMVIWTFSGIFSMCAALCFAELRESVRREGVEYAYITEAFGPLAGFVYTWMRIAAAEPTATAVFALVFSDYITDPIYDGCGPPKSITILVATLGIMTTVLVNLMSVKLSEKMQNLAIVGKTCALSVIIVMGVIRMVRGNVETIDEGMKGTKWNPSGLAFACYNGLWSYGGWTNVNNVTSGLKKPPKNVPRVVKTVIPMVLILYIMVVLSYHTAMTRDELVNAGAIGVRWAEKVLGPATPIISIGVCLTALGSLNATFLSAGRLSSVAAKNGQMPDVASWVHVSSKTPLINVFMKAVIAIFIVSIATGQECIRFYIFCAWLFHGLSIAALLVLRYKNKHKKRPYKVDMWIPVIVLIGIVYLLLAPFFQKPEPVFIVALVLFGLSIILYYPVNWLKGKKIVTVPDKLTIWLQLFLRVAPKRDLRRERRSMMRRMSILARESLFITPPIQSPAMMRRFSRRMSRLSRFEFDESPALIRKLGDQPAASATDLRRRITSRGSSLAEADMKRGRSNSMWALYPGNKPSPAIIRKKPTRGSHSFNQADMTTVSSTNSLHSLPILKNRFNTTPAATEDSEPGALAPLSSLQLQLPQHHTVRPTPSPIPEESGVENGPDLSRRFNVHGFSGGGNGIKMGSDSSNSKNDSDDLEVVADFESDGGGEYEVLAHPNDARRLSIDPSVIIRDDNDNSNSSSDSDTDSPKTGSHSDLRHTFFSSLFGPSRSSSSSGSDDSDMEDDGSDDQALRDFSHLPMFYYSDEELNFDSDIDVDNLNNDKGSNCDAGGGEGGYTNFGFEDIPPNDGNSSPANHAHHDGRPRTHWLRLRQALPSLIYPRPLHVHQQRRRSASANAADSNI